MKKNGLVIAVMLIYVVGAGMVDNNGNFCIFNSPNALKIHFSSIPRMRWLSTVNVVELDIGWKLFDQTDLEQRGIIYAR